MRAADEEGRRLGTRQDPVIGGRVVLRLSESSHPLETGSVVYSKVVLVRGLGSDGRLAGWVGMGLCEPLSSSGNGFLVAGLMQQQYDSSVLVFSRPIL